MFLLRWLKVGEIISSVVSWGSHVGGVWVRSIGTSTFGSVIDLELGEVDEDLFHIGPREREVFDHLTLEKAS